MFKNIGNVRELTLEPSSFNNNEIAVEGFLDVIKGVFGRSEPKKIDPTSWKRRFVSTKGLIKVLQNTYGNHDWVAKRGSIPNDTVNMNDVSSSLLINNAVPEDVASALNQHLFTTRNVLDNWAGIARERCNVITNALWQIGFNPEMVQNWPYYSNKLTMLLRNLKPLNFLSEYHDFEGLMGTVVVMPDGTLTIGKHIPRTTPFPKLAIDEIPNIAQAVINLLNYSFDVPQTSSAPSSIYKKVVIGYTQATSTMEARKIYASFMMYLKEHNELLAHLIGAEYFGPDEYSDSDDQGNNGKTASWVHNGSYSDSFQPYDQLIRTIDKVCFAIELWMYRSVK